MEGCHDWDAITEMANQAEIVTRKAGAVIGPVSQYHCQVRTRGNPCPQTFTGQTTGGEAVTHLNSAVDEHERAMVEQEQDEGGWVLVYVFAALVFATGVLTGYGLALAVLA